MIRKGWLFALCLALIALPAGALGAGKRMPKGKTWTWSFAADTLGQAPTECLVLGGTWHVVADSVAPGDTMPAARYLRQVEDDEGSAHNYIQFRKPVLANLKASVRFRILSGEMGPSAGLAFQLDAKGRNGYLVRVRADRGDIVAHYILYGKRRDIKFAKVEPPAPGTWHQIAIERDGNRLVVFYDGVEKIRLRDERYGEGAVGLWAEDDTVAEFRDLEVTSR